MKKILFLIHDLGQGGAEKVLVNLVNNIDRSKFDISITVLFGGGINEQFLAPYIHFNIVFPIKIPGNSKLMKLLSPKQLHQLCVKDKFDVEISYLEGPSARIISGCNNGETKVLSWIHGEQHSMKMLASSFRSSREAKKCYERFDKTICVSESVKNDFCTILNYQKPCHILYNTVDSEMIIKQAREEVSEMKSDKVIKLVAVGTLKKSKGYERLLSIVKKLCEEYSVCLYILGIGPQQDFLKHYVYEHNLEQSVFFLGYQTNPYKYMAKCDLFVCSSYAEGFSTAATESLILGVPVCTVEVAGMKEMLGKNNEYGVITDNSEEALYKGIKKLLDNPEMLAYYKRQAQIRGKFFNTDETVKAIEKMLLNM